MAKRKTPWKNIGPNERIRAEYGLVQLGNQEPYISVTGTVEEKRYGRWVETGVGAMHDEIVRHFPELEELVLWHLVSPSGPMHYLANGQYWWEHILGTNRYPLRWYDADPVEAFKSAILYGVLPMDSQLELPPPAGRGQSPTERPMLLGEPAPADIRPWLEERLPQLQDLFQDVVRRYDLQIERSNNPEPRALKSKLLR